MSGREQEAMHVAENFQELAATLKSHMYDFHTGNGLCATSRGNAEAP